MIFAYLDQKTLKPEIITPENISVLQNAIWIDLLSPTKEEEKLVEQYLELDIPTREEMQEIEFSSRFYKIENALFMTMTMVAKSDTLQPKNDAVTLVLENDKLITIRYIEPQSFALFIARLSKLSSKNYHAIFLLIELLESTIYRLADILERIGHQFDEYSQNIFRPKIEIVTPWIHLNKARKYTLYA